MDGLESAGLISTLRTQQTLLKTPPFGYPGYFTPVFVFFLINLYFGNS